MTEFGQVINFYIFHIIFVKQYVKKRILTILSKIVQTNIIVPSCISISIFRLPIFQLIILSLKNVNVSNDVSDIYKGNYFSLRNRYISERN